MKVTEHLDKATKTVFSLEVLPPLRDETIQELFDHIDPLMEFKPPFIDVTYHREEYIYKKRENGLLERISVRKRPGTVGICAAIMNRYQVDPVPHIICGGFTKSETENALIDLDYLGVENVLVLRGDAIKTEPRFKPEVDGHPYALDLLQQVKNMNRGVYLDEELENRTKTKFAVGVAAYPEKHMEAPNLRTDIEFLKKKVDAGADYAVTQMFFDNQKYFQFVEMCRDEGITIPIIPGMKPITTVRHLTVLPQIFHLDLPEPLAKELMKCKNNKEARELGIEWAIQQSKELIEYGVPCLHYYSMGKSYSVRKIAEALF